MFLRKSYSFTFQVRCNPNFIFSNGFGKKEQRNKWTNRQVDTRTERISFLYLPCLQKQGHNSLYSDCSMSFETSQ